MHAECALHTTSHLPCMDGPPNPILPEPALQLLREVQQLGLTLVAGQTPLHMGFVLKCDTLEHLNYLQEHITY